MKTKRFFAALLSLLLAVALALPAFADDDTDGSAGTAADTASEGVYVTAYTVTDIAGGEVTTVEVGDHVNLVLQVVDHSSARYNVKAEEISARINATAFEYTGTGEIGQLYSGNDDPDADRAARVQAGSATDADRTAYEAYNYYTYVLLFRDVIYRGGGNTLPINLSYLDTSKPLQQFSVTIGQCVDKDDTTTPNLVVRTSGYGESVTAGTAFDLSLGVYATDGGEALNDVIVSLTLPENVSLGGGSLSDYIGSVEPKATKIVSFSVLPAAGFTGTVADITVNMTGTGAVTGKAVSASTVISVPVSQPDRFEVGQLELSSDTIYVGDTGNVSLSYVNKGKNAVSNLEARLTGTNCTESYQYLGNLAAGTEGSVDFDLTPETAGTISGTITLTYEDAAGKATSVTKDFALTAEEIVYEDYDVITDEPVEEPSTGMPVWGWVLIAVCAIVVVIAVIVIVRKRKKAKALAQLEEGSDEDI